MNDGVGKDIRQKKVDFAVSENIKSSKAEKTEKVEVGIGFVKSNSVSHQENTVFLSNTKKIELPPPMMTAGDVTGKHLQELQYAFGGAESKNGIHDLYKEGLRVGKRAEATEAKEASQATDDTSPVSLTKLVDFPVGMKISSKPLDMKMLDNMTAQTFDVLAQLDSIESAPAEVLEKIKTLAEKMVFSALKGNPEDTALLLMEIQTELQDERIKFDSNALQANRAKQKTLHKSRIEKMQKEMDKIAEANKMGPWQKVLQWFAIAATAIVGATLLVTPGLQAAGALALAGTAVMIAQQIVNEAGVFKDDQEAGQIFNYVALGVSIALSVGAIAVTGPAGASSTTVQIVAAHARGGAQVVAGVATASAGAMTIYETSIRYDAAKYSASAKDDMAMLARLQFFMEVLMENIGVIYEQLSSGQEITSDMLKSALDSKGRVTRNLI